MVIVAAALIVIRIAVVVNAVVDLVKTYLGILAKKYLGVMMSRCCNIAPGSWSRLRTSGVKTKFSTMLFSLELTSRGTGVSPEVHLTCGEPYCKGKI